MSLFYRDGAVTKDDLKVLLRQTNSFLEPAALVSTLPAYGPTRGHTTEGQIVSQHRGSVLVIDSRRFDQSHCYSLVNVLASASSAIMLCKARLLSMLAGLADRSGAWSEL